MALFKKIGRISAPDEIIDNIKTMIFNEKLKSGERLPSEEKLAENMGVGRGTIREALKVLIYLGFIERKNNVTYVAENVKEHINIHEVYKNFSKHRNIMEIIEVRKIIEPETAYLAAKRSSLEEKNRIRKIFLEMELSQGELERFIALNSLFHLTIIEITKNWVLYDIIKSVQELMKLNQSIILKYRKIIMPRSIEYHREISDSIVAEDAERAKISMSRHIKDIEDELYMFLKNYRGDSNDYNS